MIPVRYPVKFSVRFITSECPQVKERKNEKGLYNTKITYHN
jgi:hypothetical protein